MGMLPQYCCNPLAIKYKRTSSLEMLVRLKSKQRISQTKHKILNTKHLMNSTFYEFIIIYLTIPAMMLESLGDSKKIRLSSTTPASASISRSCFSE